MKMDVLECDAVVVGSGAAGLTAAVVAAIQGLEVILLEKTAFVGGTSAWSGGVAWVPANHLMATAGKPDSIDDARRYIQSIVGEHFDSVKVDAFLENCAAAFEFLDKQTSAVRMMSYPGVDYYPSQPGATSHRGLMVHPYDAGELGHHLEELQYPLGTMVIFKSMQADVNDVYHLQRMFRSTTSFRHSARLLIRYLKDRLNGRRGTRTLRGNALVARLYRSALDAGVRVLRESPAVELIQEQGRITGVICERGKAQVQIKARCGVILASGGVSGNESFRSKLLPFAKDHVSMLPAGNVGDGVNMAIARGAQLGSHKPVNACLTPVSVRKAADGSLLKYPHLAFDRCKPGSIMVDAHGRRFTNEAGTYHDVARAMQEAGAVPAYLIADAKFQRWYGMGMARPFPYPVTPMVACGYLIEAATIESLADKLGIDKGGLKQTVEQMNKFAKEGLDTEFGRGSNSYNLELGDAEHRPNPCLGEIREAPFYAVKLYPGDIGTLVGLKANKDAQVLDAAGQPIPGLYACGLDIDNVFNGFYPGAGSTHGPNMTFAYVAAMHMARTRKHQVPMPYPRVSLEPTGGTQ